MLLNFRIGHELHAVAVWVVRAKGFMAVRATAFEDAEVVAHVAFIAAGVAAEGCAVLGEELGAVPAAGAAIVEAVDDGEVGEGLVVGIVDGVALAFVFRSFYLLM